MIILWILVGVVLLTAALAVLMLRPSTRSAAPRNGSPLTVDASHVATVTLEVDDVDPASPAVQRLVRETALAILRTAPDAREVVVRARTGAILGRVGRETPMPREVMDSPALHEPHVRRTHVPDVLGGLYGSEPAPDLTRDRHTAGELAPAPRPLTDQFDLPAAVRAAIRDPHDPIDLVRAVLQAAGVPHEVDGDLIRVGESALVVVRASGDVVVGHEALNHAYLRIARSGAQRGLVIALGFMDPREVKRREMLAPQILHTGPDGIQRMADAVSFGADPPPFRHRCPRQPRAIPCVTFQANRWIRQSSERRRACPLKKIVSEGS